jgi:RHS repeat-associated protein
LQELDAEQRDVARYEYGADRLVSVLRRDEPRRFYHQDALGSVTALTDRSGDVAARYHLDAWGNFRFPTELDSSKNRFAFTGHVWDEETGLYNAKARYFDPKLGRFLTQDSYLGQIDNPPSLHRFYYAYANPLRYIDPTGHQAADPNAPADDIVGGDRALAAVKAQQSQASPELQAVLESNNAPNPKVVQEETWLSTFGRAVKGKWNAGWQKWDEFWAQKRTWMGDQTEAAGRGAIKTRPLSQQAEEKQRGADILQELDPANTSFAERERSRADLAERGREQAGDISRAAGEGAVTVTQAVTEAEAPGRLLRIGEALAAERRVARTTEDVLEAQRAESRLVSREVGQLEPGNPASRSFPRDGNRTVFNQGSGPTCGSVSCGMVLDTAGKPVDLGTLATQAGVSARGTTMDKVASALRQNGIGNARLQRVSIGDLAAATSKGDPAIVRMNLNRGGHAVVVDGFTLRQGEPVVAIRDPASGRQYFTPLQEFQDKFSGEAILTNVPRKSTP